MTIQAPPAPVIRFRVRGQPTPQGSKKIIWPKGRDVAEAYLVDDNPTTLKEWRRACHTACSFVFRGQPFTGPLAVRMVFYFIRPAGHTRLQRLVPWRHQTPDVEKIARAVNDALKGLAWVDDAQVSLLVVAKRYAEGDHLPGVEVTIRSLT